MELGPGQGTLMADALRACGKVAPSFLEAASIHFIETSAALREKQRQAMGDHPAQWYDKFSQIPKGPLIVIGNEFLDALPVHQLVRTGAGWCERQIARTQEGDLFFTVANKTLSVIGAFASGGGEIRHRQRCRIVTQGGRGDGGDCRPHSYPRRGGFAD